MLYNPLKIFSMSEISSDDCVKIDQFGDYYNVVIQEMFTDRPGEIQNYLNKYMEFMEWLKSDKTVTNNPDSHYSNMPPYPYWIVRNIVRKIIKINKKICTEDVEMLKKKIIGYTDFDYMMRTGKNPMGGKRHKRSGKSGHKKKTRNHKSRRSTRRHRR